MHAISTIGQASVDWCGPFKPALPFLSICRPPWARRSASAIVREARAPGDASMTDVFVCFRCGKRFPGTAMACPSCGASSVWDVPDPDPPARRGRFSLGVLAAVAVAALLAVLWTMAAQ